ncbi:MAG: GNAT family N-acetyltransferase [Cyanophyceae cyanobacterium]
MTELLPGYELQVGSSLERSRLFRWLTRTYQELFPHLRDFSHLDHQINQHFSRETPLWWVTAKNAENLENQAVLPSASVPLPIAGLWWGWAVDQASGQRLPHVFWMYVLPDYRRRGIGRSLLKHLEMEAQSMGATEISLQVYGHNAGAIALYQSLGYESKAILMRKSLGEKCL